MKVTKNGRVTIPKAIRKQLNIQPGTELEFLVQEDAALLRKVKSSTTVYELFNLYRGVADVPMSTEEILQLTRWDR